MCSSLNIKYLATIFILLTFFNTPLAHALTVTYLVAESGKDTRREYNNQLLELALIKTQDSHGSYHLQPSKPMNLKRATEEVEKGNLLNFVVKLSANKQDLARFGFVNFPVDLGIVGSDLSLYPQSPWMPLKKYNI